uniref:Uncharacterized protein n=1 Tax=Kalanchoe fedtschenkoi TaxID=63787 RepID=A0A7N0ZXX3_KALFE
MNWVCLWLLESKLVAVKPKEQQSIRGDDQDELYEMDMLLETARSVPVSWLSEKIKNGILL